MRGSLCEGNSRRGQLYSLRRPVWRRAGQAVRQWAPSSLYGRIRRSLFRLRRRVSGVRTLSRGRPIWVILW